VISTKPQEGQESHALESGSIRSVFGVCKWKFDTCWNCYVLVWNVAGQCWGSLPSQARELIHEAADWLISESQYMK
jgi:hypothetical protein